jgi:hypothetical protein
MCFHFLLGSLITFLLGGSTRHSYTIAGCQAHPDLHTYWEPSKTCREQFCSGGKDIPDPVLDDEKISRNIPFPFVDHEARGTPEHETFTDFNNVLVGNERSFLDLFFNGILRGFKSRLNTGSRKENGQPLFYISRPVFYKWYMAPCNMVIKFFTDAFCCPVVDKCCKSEEIKGRHNLRYSPPCTKGIAAFRISFPTGIT